MPLSRLSSRTSKKPKQTNNAGDATLDKLIQIQEELGKMIAVYKNKESA
jgi:hypothetical protein